MITLDQLQVFEHVVEAGSFSAASRKLRRAQSAVSTAIANLEAQLDVQLFDRSGRSPVLTEAGRALLVDVHVVTSKVDGLLQRARWLSSSPEPQVSLAVDVMFPMTALVTQLADFRATFPQVAIEVHTESLGGVVQLVLDGICGLGVGMSFGDIPGPLRHHPAVTVGAVAVAASGHPLSSLGADFDPEHLDDHTQVVLTDRSGLTAGQTRGVHSTRTWRVADLFTKRAMLRAGLGWGLMPQHMVEDDLAAGRLVGLSPRGWPAQTEITLHAMVHPRRPLGPAAAWLRDRLAGCSA